MIISLLIILLIFVVALAIVWIWFINNEKAAYRRLYALGVKAAEKNDFQKAKNLLLKALSLNSAFKEAKCELCMVYSKLEEHQASKECFESALKANPKDFDTLFNYAELLKMQKKYDEAKDFYLRALKENNKSRDCLFNLGYISFLQNDYVGAMDFFVKILELSSEDIGAHFYLTRCKDEMCKYETEAEGQAIIDEYLEIANKEDLPSEFHISFARSYAKNGNINKALSQCQSALIKDAENIDSYNLLGLIQLLKKDVEGAKNSLTTVVNLESGNAEAHELLSYVFCQQQGRCALNKCREKYHELVNKFIKKNSADDV